MIFPRPFLGSLFVLTVSFAAHAAPLRVGAFVQDVSPTVFPVIINGGMAERLADKVVDPVVARAFVIEGDNPAGGGREKIAIVVVDSCMLPRELLDVAKGKAKALTGIPTDRMLISATHTHSAPSSMGCLGSDEDLNYTKTLPDQLAKAIAEADKRLVPAQIGWTVVQDPDHTAVRRWIFRPDRMRKDPFGDLTVRANMHPGHLSPDAISEAGPEDPGLTIISFRHADGRPLGLLANYSMHYFSSPAVSADYFGKFAAKVSAALAPDDKQFVAAMSQGTSGDVWLADYTKPAPKEKRDIEVYSRELAESVTAATKGIKYASEAPVAMAEATLKLKRRVPDEKRLAWAREKVAALQKATGEGKPLKPKQQPDIYAREAIFLHEAPERELKLQALRIGDFALTAIPNEVYALTGLKLKAMSPLPTTANISLANGSEGYIPPPEQHPLGGYTTWPARTAALEPQAEPRIVETVATLLEQVAGKPCKPLIEAQGPYAKAILDAKPLAYWRMADAAGPVAGDATGNNRDGRYETGVVFWLPGAESTTHAITGAADHINRAAHFAGGRMTASAKGLEKNYTVEMLVWNGLAHEARPVTAYLFSRGPAGDKDAPGDHLGIAGTHENGKNAGRLIVFNGNARNQLLAGKTPLATKAWHHVALVREGAKISVYLNGRLEIAGDLEPTSSAESLFLGGRSDNFATLEGRLDEVALYGKALSADEIAAHAKLAELAAAPQTSAAPTEVKAPVASAAPTPYKRTAEPRSPQDSLKTIHVAPDYAIELVAHEPLVVDPVAIDWGYDGKLWVVEFADYPYGMDGKGSPGGRIKFLTDTDGDGKYDTATLFLDKVKMPTSVMAWRKGVLIAAAPEIFYAEDTDGDGKADKREVLYKGFKEGNPQLRVNALRWGLDNWVYVSNGLSGGVVESARAAAKGKPIAPLDIKNKDLRVRPDTGEMELISGPSQWGRARDAFGRWFGTHNAQPLFHLALEDRYLRRNPDVTYPDARTQLLDRMPPLFPKSPFAKRYIGLDHHGHFTSGSGISVETTRLTSGGTEPVIRAYVCDPVHNLVQAQDLSESRATFSASRVAGAAKSDFVAGEDPWFRPVMTRPGPDGALWVVDMYRYMIEHPDWLNEQGKRELAPFYRDGDDKGRIYRVYRKGTKLKAMPMIRLTDSRQNLIEAMTSNSAVVRDLAHRALIWQIADGGGVDASFRENLEHLIATSDSPDVQAQLIGVLDGAGGVTAEFANRLLALRHPGLVAQAVRIAERLEWKTVGPRLSEIATATSDPFLRVQLACTLGQFDNPDAGAALATLAATGDPDDALLAAAIASSAKPHEKALVDRVLTTPALAGKPLADHLLTMAVRRKDTATVGRFADKLLADPNPSAAQLTALAKLADVLAARGMSLADLDKPVAAGRLDRLRAILDTAARRAADDRADPADRRAATELLGRLPDRRAADLATAAALLVPRTPSDVQLAAVRAVARTQDPAAPQSLLAAWPSLSPAVRVAIADALMAREPWAAELAKSPAARELDFARKQRLLNHKSAAVKDAAKATLASTGPGSVADRQKVIDEYAPAMRLAPDMKHGQQVYAEQCATCHQIGSLADAAGKPVGHDIGPNLLTVRDWTKESLLAGILDPDRTVAPQFIAYNATTAAGDQHTGLIVAESAGGISIRTVDGRVHEIPRASLKSLVSTGRSLMPQGFEAALSPQDVADLMGFITDPSRR